MAGRRKGSAPRGQETTTEAITGPRLRSNNFQPPRKNSSFRVNCQYEVSSPHCQYKMNIDPLFIYRCTCISCPGFCATASLDAALTSLDSARLPVSAELIRFPLMSVRLRGARSQGERHPQELSRKADTIANVATINEMHAKRLLAEEVCDLGGKRVVAPMRLPVSSKCI